MSMSPSGTSAPVSSPTIACSLPARTAPRVWMPTSASSPEPGFFSAISWAIRFSVRRRSSRSSTTFSLTLAPSRPLWTALKEPTRRGYQGLRRMRPGLPSRDGLLLGGVGRLDLGRPLVAPVAGALLDQGRLAPLGERDLDEVEVARRDRRGERLAGLVEDGLDVVAGGDVDEGEQLDGGLTGQRRRLACSRMAGLGGALCLLLGEARVV